MLEVMKRCPKCNKVFENERRFCTHDGGELITDEFALPSEFEDKETEEQTVLRANPPIRIPAQRARSVSVPVQPAAREYAGNDVGMPGTSPVKKSGGCLKYSIILILGLLIGGGFVLAIVGAGSGISRKGPELRNKPRLNRRHFRVLQNRP